MRVLVCGGRNFNNTSLLVATLDPLYWDKGMTVLIEGEASGADKMAAWWAKAYNIKIEKYPAQWNKYGKAAGYVRNVQMLEEGKPDLVIAFPGDKGTAMMCRLAEAVGIEVRKIKEV